MSLLVLPPIFNPMQGVCKTKVHCKVAPSDPGLAGCIELANKQTATLLIKKDRYEQVKFHFDSVLPCDSSPYEVYQSVCKKAIKRFVMGNSIALVTYGQSGLGKTFSLYGNGLVRGNIGLIQQSLEDIYSRLLRDKERMGRLGVSVLAMYQEHVTDLLNPRKTVRGEHVTLNTAKSVELQGVSHALSILSEAISPSASGKVFCKPSRGHYVIVFTLNRHGHPSQQTEESKQVTRSHFFVVDLPGFERVKKSGVSGTYLEEAKHINHSLFVFAQCLQSERGRRPYRDSVLTLVLHPMFKHVSEIDILSIISGKTEDVEETISTLTFSQNSMNLRTISQTLHANAKDEATYLNSLVEERERQITDKDAKLLIQTAENEELKQQIVSLTLELGEKLESLTNTIAKIKEKNSKLRANLAEMTKAVRRTEDERDEMTRTQRVSLERRLKDEAEQLERQKEMEMTEFRIKTATEVSQAFASKVQRMTAEHELTVGKLMEALLEKQKQEQRLIALVQKEQEEIRRLKGEMDDLRANLYLSGPIKGSIHTASCYVLMQAETWPFPLQATKRRRESPPPAIPESLQHYSDSSIHSIIRPLDLSPKETSINRDAVVQTSEGRSDMSPIEPLQVKDLEASLDRSSSLPSMSLEPESKSHSDTYRRSLIESEKASRRSIVLAEAQTVDKSFVQSLKFALQRSQEKVSVTKLDRKGRVKTRDVWMEGVEAFIKSEESDESEAASLWGQTLAGVTIIWSTTSRFKRKSSLSFHISEVDDAAIGQDSAGFEKNGSLQDKAHLSLWVKYRSNSYFEVIFPDRMTTVIWNAGIRLAKLAINSPSPPFSAWQAERSLLVTECGMKFRP